MENGSVVNKREFILGSFDRYITEYRGRKVINIYTNTLLETQILFNCLNSIGFKWITGDDLINYDKLNSIYYSMTKFNKKFIFLTYIDIQDLNFFTDSCISCTVCPCEQFYNIKAISYSRFMNVIDTNKDYIMGIQAE